MVIDGEYWFVMVIRGESKGIETNNNQMVRNAYDML